MQSVVVLEWQFSPPDFFEEPDEIVRDGYKVSIGIGEIEARIDAAVYDVDPSLRQKLHDGLNRRFQAFQLESHRAYELSRPKTTRVHPDGREDCHLDLEAAEAVVATFSIDYKIKDADGNVIADSKRDRIEKNKRRERIVSAHPNDDLLASLLRSYDKAMRDRDNELGHLYEIRDALADKYGKNAKAKAHKALGISSTDWDNLGELCNDKPLRQGRHRGKHRGKLRDATENELTKARDIASRMIDAYLAYLERTFAQPEPSTPAGRGA